MVATLSVPSSNTASSNTVRPAMVAQPSLLGLGSPSIDPTLAGIRRRHIGTGAWIDHLPGWLQGHQVVFDRLADEMVWEQHQRPMYERIVDVPRLTGSRPEAAAASPELAVIGDMADALGRHYESRFDRLGYALYRDGADSVAWHGDQIAREMSQALVATVSVGEPRKFCLRPKQGGASISFMLGHGDLIVMGGTCQRTWDHAVPKVARAGPRIAVMFRPRWPGIPPEATPGSAGPNGWVKRGGDHSQQVGPEV